MSRNRIAFTAIFSILFLFIFVAFQNCGIERPHAERSMASSSFDHIGVTNNCKDCHLKNYSQSHRPTDNQDCSICHTPRGWLPAQYNHTPEPNLCAGCHQQQLPQTGHPNTQGNDCKSCHVTTGWRGANPHNPVPTQCASCHGDGAPQDRWQPTHRPVGTNDCITCHTTSGWQTATFSHSPTPTSCNSCHEQQRPTTTINPEANDAQVSGHYNAKDCLSCHKVDTTFRFDHYMSNGLNINFCLPCHKDNVKAIQKHKTPHPEYFVGDGTCYDCHNKKRRSWDH